MSAHADGFLVWCQGGAADDFRYATGVEPPAEIWLMRMPEPWDPGNFIRVLPDWPDAIVYVRVPEVEQFDHERIYYPKEVACLSA